MRISDSVTFTGKIDWELRHFHGEELSTEHGSSYNSYLIKDEKNVLIDTVWQPYSEEFINNLRREVDLDKIDYVVSLHGEPDHSGCLVQLMELIPNVPLICSANGAKSLRGLYHRDWNFQIVKSGDTLSLGKHTLSFIEAPMLHWPDTMTAYLDGEGILFSSDIFGQHLATEFLFADKIDRSILEYEALKYYANIIAPFNAKVLKKIEEIKGMSLNINMICPAHGAIWRNDDCRKVIEMYTKWASAYSEDQITIVYDTMYNATRHLAESLARGIVSVSPETEVKLFNLSRSDRSDVITEIYRSRAILVGSPAVNGGILSSIAGLAEDVKNLNISGKKAAVFGSYGWSPANLKQLTEKFTLAGLEVLTDSIKCQWQPDAAALLSAEEFGRKMAEGLNE